MPGTAATSPAAASNGTARVTVKLTVPSVRNARAGRGRPDYVSAGTNSASIAVSTASTTDGSPTILNCTSGQTCSTTVPAPVGSDTFTVTLYAESGGQGAVLGLGSALQTVSLGALNTVSLTLNGVVNTVALVANPASLPAGTAAAETVNVEALDAAGDTIVAPGGYVDTNGNPVSISVSKTDYGGGTGKTVFASPSPGPVATGPGTQLTYSYNGSDIDATVFTSATSVTIAGAQGSASVDYVPTLGKRFADTAGADTNFLAAGPDGNVWFSDFDSGDVGSIVPGTGAITHYSIPSSTTNGGAEAEAIVAGPSDTMYFAEFNSNAIGSISTTAAATLGAAAPITETDLTTTNANPRGIAYNTVCSPNIWFTEYNGDKIGTLSTTALTITEYDAGLSAAAMPDQIACGPDGNFWFTEYGTNKIGQITNAGAITEYPLPNPGSPHGPIGIVAGADGSMWFTESTGNMISKITTSKTVPAGTPVGTIVEYSLPPPPGNPNGPTMAPALIVSAPDGDLFFSEFNSETQTTNAMIGRFTTSASVVPGTLPAQFSQYPLTATSSMPFGITLGPDGHIWFGEMGSNYLGYLFY
jgi:streptogramin lyase